AAELLREPFDGPALETRHPWVGEGVELSAGILRPTGEGGGAALDLGFVVGYDDVRLRAVVGLGTGGGVELQLNGDAVEPASGVTVIVNDCPGGSRLCLLEGSIGHTPALEDPPL